ncbi:MAG: zinc-dependent peptidase [Candidatus Nitricoxidivorans perseverans]|uniref:Zinc-dependent peptidase n=1 Tax=Candidatus Nitricoxidivorans perseverans TaxID=2975601 RepID=A0AA49IYL3_9PROT|nr:MAG: zinc-dependent peptidase [Candidatus Nitricoxidivorans perseverans]
MFLGFFREWRRGRAINRITVTDDQWRSAERHLHFLDRLADADRLRLRQMAREFLATKEWTGARGLDLDAGMQISIALQACLPVLNLGLDWYRGWVGIVVYPGDFVIPRQVMDEDGVMHEYDDPVLGEAWEGGPVLVSWFESPEEAGGVNVVIHEFAHKLDMRSGAVDGLPPLHADMSRRAWIAAFEPAFEDFRRRVDEAEARNEDTLLDPYAAEHPSEFFAVMSEAFFETPELLRGEYPAVYEQLRRFYRQDPAAIPVAVAAATPPAAPTR